MLRSPKGIVLLALASHLMLFFLASFVCLGDCLNNGLALTPPMGWSTWERFRCNLDCENDPDNCISERLIKTIADSMVKEGYKDAGYVYVNIDDCWMAKKRDPKTLRLQPDPKRFPSGIKALADYLHRIGLKLGIYADYGLTTCMSYPGSMYYLQMDAQTFADWGVDFVKFDCCASNPKDWGAEYPPMEMWLNFTGHPFIYSTAWPKLQINHGVKPDYKKIAATCHMSRNTNDLQDGWDSMLDIMTLYGKNEGNFSEVAGPGYWNNPEEVIIGDFGLSYDQERVQMALWAILASPLILSSDLRNLRPASKALILNKNALAINQDKMGIPGKLIIEMGKKNWIKVWTRPVAPKGSMAFALVNIGNEGTPEKVAVSLKKLGLSDQRGYNITEVFDGKQMGFFKSSDMFKTQVNPTGVFFGKASLA